MTIRLQAVVWAALSIAGTSGALAASSADPVTMLLFSEEERGIEPFPTRMLFNDRYLRIDDGYDEGSFLLLDRAAKTVYNVHHRSRSITVIHSKAVTMDPPIELNYEERKQAHPDAPAIEGQKAVEYTLMVNEKACLQMMVVPDFMPQAIEAMSDFRHALAGQHAANIYKTPEEMLDPCFLAHHVFKPAREYEYGFPMQVWDDSGTRKALLDYDTDAEVDGEVFELPDNYRRVEMDGGAGA